MKLASFRDEGDEVVEAIRSYNLRRFGGKIESF
jgi:hypothetical protein